MPVTVRNYIRDAARGGKFVVLVRDDDPAAGGVVFSDFTRDFQHYDIVRRWETEAKTTVAQSDLRVAGGGWWKYEGTDTLVVYGQSAAYGRFEPSWLRERLLPGMLLREKSVDVR